MKNFMKNRRGIVIPIALLLTIVSILFTAAYLRWVVSDMSTFRYREAQTRAKLLAQTGLSEMARQIWTDANIAIDDTIFHGEDFNRVNIKPGMGEYDSLRLWVSLDPQTGRKLCNSSAVGRATYKNFLGDEVVARHVEKFTLVPEDFSVFMYFSSDEHAGGGPYVVDLNPLERRVVNFGSADALEGKIHSNTSITMSNFGCPTLADDTEITTTGTIIFSAGCQENTLFPPGNEDDENAPTYEEHQDTIIYPPQNAFRKITNASNYVFPATQKLHTGDPTKKDTLTMTEIVFLETGGFKIAQWWYVVDPLDAGGVIDYYNEIQPIFEASCNSLIMGCHSSGNGFNYFLGLTDYDDVMDGSNNGPVVIPGDGNNSLLVQKMVVDDDDFLIAFDHAEPYPPAVALTEPTPEDIVKIRNWIDEGAFEFPDDENDIDSSDYYTPGFFSVRGRWHNFDFQPDPTYLHRFHPNGSTSDGTDVDHGGIWDMSDFNDNHWIMTPQDYSTNQAVIVVEGGQLLISGVVKGQYTVATTGHDDAYEDGYTLYRRHREPTVIDTVWNNIWLLDDIIYVNSNAYNGAVPQPPQFIEGGTGPITERLGIVSSANVIVANTRENGGRNSFYDDDIIINGAIIAFNESFLHHYWQNTLTVDGGGDPPLGDGRGNERMGGTTGANDNRGDIIIWGSLTQMRRGYVARNPLSPYGAGRLEYGKDYNYDYNLRVYPPPAIPELETTTGKILMQMVSFGQ